jgi:hypothetical protein
VPITLVFEVDGARQFSLDVAAETLRQGAKKHHHEH